MSKRKVAIRNKVKRRVERARARRIAREETKKKELNSYRISAKESVSSALSELNEEYPDYEFTFAGFSNSSDEDE